MSAIIADFSSRCMQRRFGVVSVYRRVTAQGDKVFESWPQEDRGVLKNLLEKFQDLASRKKLRLSSLCSHTKGQGGVKRALGEVDAALRSGDFTHVCRSDAKSYYAFIRRDIFFVPACPAPAACRFAEMGGRLLPAHPSLRRAVRRMNEVLTALHLRQHPDKTWIGRLTPGAADGSREKTFDFLGMDFSKPGLCGLSEATASRVREVTAQVDDRTAREARQGGRKAPGQAAVPLPTQAEFLRRMETLRSRWQRSLKGILASFHHHLGATATGALFERLCAQHRHHSSSNHGLNPFPLPRWQGESTKRQTTQKNMCEKYKKMGLAAAACTLLGIHASQAAVTLTFSQAGADVTATWSGSYEVKSSPDSSGFLLGLEAFVSAQGAYGISGSIPAIFPLSSGGTFAPSPLSLFTGSYVGDLFGFYNTALYLPAGSSLGDTVSPVGTMTFTNTTLAAMGADGLSSFLAYTGAGNIGESSKIYLTTASVSAIPEPSGVVGVAGLLAGGLLIRRRKRGCGRG